ncbi:MAG: LysM peptidoglycan-binding domain-containing protein, partial [Bacteroidota bacterium]
MKKLGILIGLVTVFWFAKIPFAFAQERWVEHTVQEGETLYSIAKQYRVTPYAILQKNEEVKSVSDLKPDTILIIPVRDSNAALPPPEKKFVPEEATQQQLEPERFLTHLVKRKETLFSLTQQYEVTEDQIKRYNTDLYANPLQVGMVLKIPQYPEVAEEQPLDFEVYTVQPLETRWSIAHKYGITVDSLLLLNPELPKSSNYLAVGEQLRLPRPKGDSLKDQEVTLFQSYTVPKSIGLFRISQNFGISVDSVMALNPEIKEIGGLREGMVLRLPKQQATTNDINTENYIYYQVKPKQNIFRLTRNLGISRDSLFLLNPELENGLKSGMVLKLPKEKKGELKVKNALVLDQFNLADSINRNLAPNVMFLLPFRLDRIDFKNAEKTENQIASRKDITYAMGLYSGSLVAIDSLKKMGVSIKATVVDTERSLDKVKAVLDKCPWYEVDAILGPVDPTLLPEIAVRANTYNVPVMSPFASESAVSLGNVFFSNPS